MGYIIETVTTRNNCEQSVRVFDINDTMIYINCVLAVLLVPRDLVFFILLWFCNSAVTGAGPFTLFAPTNAAFQALAGTLQSIVADSALLTSKNLYYISKYPTIRANKTKDKKYHSVRNNSKTKPHKYTTLVGTRQ